MADKPDRARTGGRNPPLTTDERDLIVVINDVMARQKAEAVAATGKALKDSAKVVIEAQKWNGELADLSYPVLIRPFEKGGNAALRAIGVALPEWIESPRVYEAVKAESFLFAQQVNSTVADTLRVALMDGVAKGETVAQIEQRVVAVYDGWRDANKAEMIARTETARANTLGEIEAWKESGVVVAKKWDAAGDACPFCLAMDGKTVALESSYFEKGETMSVEFHDHTVRLPFNYADVPGPPLHPNCRCALVAEIEE